MKEPRTQNAGTARAPKKHPHPSPNRVIDEANFDIVPKVVQVTNVNSLGRD